MSKALLIALALMLGSLMFLGCSEDDDGGPTGNGDGHPPAEMIGSWIFQSATVNGAAANLPDVMEWHVGSVQARLHIQENSAYVYDEVLVGGGQNWWESGFVYVEGGEIDINVQQDGDGPVNETEYATYTLAEGVFTLTMQDEGDTVVFTLMQ